MSIFFFTQILSAENIKSVFHILFSIDTRGNNTWGRHNVYFDVYEYRLNKYKNIYVK